LGGAEAPPLHPNLCVYVWVNLQVHPNVSKCLEMSTYSVDNLNAAPTRRGLIHLLVEQDDGDPQTGAFARLGIPAPIGDNVL
jgi:hypothetical protein